MVLRYQISPAPTLTENLLVKIYEASNENPGAEVFTQELAQDIGGGFANPSTVIANGLDNVVHIVKLFGKDSATLFHNYEAEPKVDTVTVFDPIRFKIGDGNVYTPAVGDNTYTNPLLVGLEEAEYLIHRNNYGYLFPINHYGIDSGAGSFQLVNDDEFGDAEEFTITRKSKVITTVINDSVVGKWFGGFVDIIANRDYAAVDLRKLFRFGATCTYFFRNTSAVPIGYGFIFQNFGPGATPVGTVKFENAPLLWNNTTKDHIDIPLYCEAAFVFDGVNWNVIYINTSVFINNSTTILPGATIAVGQLFVGNAPNSAWLYTVTHNRAIVGNYFVFLSIMGTVATAAQDSTVILSWRHHATDKPNNFHVIGREFAAETQNYTITWLIIKA